MNTKLKTILSIVLSVLLLAALAIVMIAIAKLDMLPGAYLAVLVALFAFVWLAVTLLLVWPSKKVRKTRAIIACILTVVLIAGCAGLTNVIGKFYETMNSITNTTIISTEYSIYVMADTGVKDLNGLAGATFGISYVAGDTTLNKALAALEKELGSSVKTTAYATVPELVNALYFGEVNAIIMDSAYVSLLEEFEIYADFHNRTRDLYQITVEEEVVIPTTPPTQDPTEPPSGNGAEPKPDKNVVDPFVMYISGSDTRNPTLSRSRSDVNILVVVNPQTKQILLLNTPRDYFVPNPAGNGVLDKLTHCGIYGINCSIQALSDLYDVSIDSYAQLNFTGFKTLIDAIGGITVYSDLAFSSAGYNFHVGLNEMNGDAALAFARARYGLPGGDNARGKNQMKVISAVIDKMTSSGALISNYSEIMNSLQGMFQTNFQMEQIAQLVKMQLSDMSSWNVQSYAVTGSGSSKITYSMPGQYVYVMVPHEKTVAYGSQLIDRVLSGEQLTPEDMIVPAN